MNVDNFKGSFVEFARASLFEVTIPEMGSDFRFQCKASQLPGSAIDVQPIKYMGREIKIAGDRTYEDWNTTVLLDEDYSVYKALYDWFENINATKENVTDAAYLGSAMKRDASVQTFKRDGSLGVKYDIVGMWPATIPAIDLDWEASTVVELPIVWTIDYFTLATS